MTGIVKHFGATRALDGVTLAAYSGQVHAVIGENGAGKSTLMKVLSGALTADSGVIHLGGRLFNPLSPMEGRESGVAMIYQELALARHLTVAENIMLGIEPGKSLFLDKNLLKKTTQTALKEVGLDPGLWSQATNTLSLGEQQLVEVARAIASGFQVLVLDEPSSSLTNADRVRLFQLIAKLRDQGKAIIYISHFMEEIFEISDSYTVLRDGRDVETGYIKEASVHQITSAMVGRNLKSLYHRSARQRGEAVLILERLSGTRLLQEASLTLYKGEILGIGGLVGSGRTELLRTIFGLSSVKDGKIRMVTVSGPVSPKERWERGVGMVSENRKEEGLALSLSVRDNLTLTRLSELSTFGFLSKKKQKKAASIWLDRLGVKYHSSDQPVGELSGGNQQKVALARLLHHDCEILLLDEPTRGIDISSKAQIYKLIDQLATGNHSNPATPRSILLVSNYLPELMGVCDRIAVMARGYLSPAQPVSQLSEQQIMELATTLQTQSGSL
jgi:ribose transport system ATP-binding protein